MDIVFLDIIGDFHITVKHIDLDDLIPTHQIKEFTRQENQLTVATVDDADNPQIAIPVAISLTPGTNRDISCCSQRWILKIFAVGIFSALLLWIWFPMG